MSSDKLFEDLDNRFLGEMAIVSFLADTHNGIEGVFIYPKYLDNDHSARSDIGISIGQLSLLVRDRGGIFSLDEKGEYRELDEHSKDVMCRLIRRVVRL